MTRPPRLDSTDLALARAANLPREEIQRAVMAAGMGKDTAVIVDALVGEAADHAARVAVEDTERQRIASLGRPVYELPFLSSGIDLAALYELSGMLKQQGMA